MVNDLIRTAITEGRVFLGVELGSTRIKAVLIDEAHKPIASGSYSWENKLENGIWTYSLDSVWEGLRTCYADMNKQVEERYGVSVTRLGALGFSAMMHGYLPFGASGEQLAPFRTWRNTITGQAAAELSECFGFNIPQRWSIAHLYQAMLNGEEHVKEIARLTTLAGYVHYSLTGENVLGVGEASGMFPIDSTTGDYDARMVELFDEKLAAHGCAYKLRDILPRVANAGEPGGCLTEEGARLLDPTGKLLAGVPLCPPEGDAGTGMVATNSVAARTGNVSAGTSIFAMIVLEKALSRAYPEIDMVTTPTGLPVAMVHCNNCTSELDAWVGLFTELGAKTGATASKGQLYDVLYNAALEGAPDADGIVAYNYFSGEPVTGLDEGRPLLMRLPDSKLSLGGFMRAQLYSAMATLRLGMDILFKENVSLDCLMGHGGLFKTERVGQQLMASALNVPVAVMTTAGEGGPWGMAILAAYMKNKQAGDTLEGYLAERVFAGEKGSRIDPNDTDKEGFAAYIARYSAGLAAERAAVDSLK